MTRNCAIIDCGTNTFNLLIAKIDSGTIQYLHQEREPVKLGSGGMEKNEITQEAMDRAILALEKYLDIIRSFDCENVQCIATSMVRGASNGALFTKRVNEKTGIEVQVIDGNREAELIYLGVKLALGVLKGNFLIMDIGGGSTEFILANELGILWKQSTPLGITRVFEKFRPDDPITKNDLSEIQTYVLQQTESLSQMLTKYPCDYLVGASGSFESLCTMLSADKVDLEKFQLCTKIQLQQYAAVRDKIWNSNLEGRLKIPGLIAYRAETIPVSIILIQSILELHSFQAIFCSPYALKEGAIVEIN